MPDAITVLQDNVVITKVAGYELLEPLVDLAALSVSAAQTAEGGAVAAKVLAQSARDGAVAARDAAALSASSIEGIDNFYPNQAAGEAAVTNGVFTTVDGGGNLIYIKRVSGVSTQITPGAFATLTGEQTLSGKTFTGPGRFLTDGARVLISNQDAIPGGAGVEAILHVVNDTVNFAGSAPGALITSIFAGSAADPFQNHDNLLCTTHNFTIDDSTNNSWGASINNAYHKIPAGVEDGGVRYGMQGWATSVRLDLTSAGGIDYHHEGTLDRQVGVFGVAGFQNSGHGAGAVINSATGVTGRVYADGGTINQAFGGSFVSTGGAGAVVENYGVYARAQGGTAGDWSFFGDGGKFFNADQAQFGSAVTESSSAVAARGAGNSYEFGFTDAGYGSNLGATASLAYPFLALCAEAEAGGDTFRTRGSKGVVISSNLAGALIFSRLPTASATGQALVESARFSADGHLQFVDGDWNTPHVVLGDTHIWEETGGVLRCKSGAPASATDGILITPGVWAALPSPTWSSDIGNNAASFTATPTIAVGKYKVEGKTARVEVLFTASVKSGANLSHIDMSIPPALAAISNDSRFVGGGNYAGSGVGFYLRPLDSGFNVIRIYREGGIGTFDATGGAVAIEVAFSIEYELA